MADLKKWFPFKFRRSEAKAEGKESAPAETGSGAVATAPRGGSWPGLSLPADMSRMMERMFHDPFFTRPFSMLGEMDRFFGDFSPATFSPTVDLVDEGTHVKVTAELPGLGKDDIELSVHEGAMTLRGEKKHEEKKGEEGCYRTERYFGSFQRTIPLPVDVDLDKAEAKFDKGVLTVRFPKTERAEESRTIPVG